MGFTSSQRGAAPSLGRSPKPLNSYLYGLRALIDLTRHRAEVPISLGQLAERNNLPRTFLEQILITLRNGGIVQAVPASSSTNGAAAPTRRRARWAR